MIRRIAIRPSLRPVVFKRYFEMDMQRAPKRMPSPIRYFKTNPSAPVIFLMGWTLSVMAGLLHEKNKYEEMERTELEKIERLEQLLQRVRSKDETLTDVEREITAIEMHRPSFDEALDDVEQYDKEWSEEMSKQIEASIPEQPKNKKRSDVSSGFV